MCSEHPVHTNYLRCQERFENQKMKTVDILRNRSLNTSILILAHQKEMVEVQHLFVCQYGHKMVYKGSKSSPNGMNKMIYLVCSSRIFDMLGYV